MDYSKLTLGELLSSQDETIKRNATSILKQLQRNAGDDRGYCNRCEGRTEKWLYNVCEDCVKKLKLTLN